MHSLGILSHCRSHILVSSNIYEAFIASWLLKPLFCKVPSVRDLPTLLMTQAAVDSPHGRVVLPGALFMWIKRLLRINSLIPRLKSLVVRVERILHPWQSYWNLILVYLPPRRVCGFKQGSADIIKRLS